MPGYYADHLAGERLRACYALAPPRVRQYLEAEIRHVLTRLGPDDTVLELGCGYGRVIARLAGPGRMVVGIDTAPGSLRMAVEFLQGCASCHLAQMDAGALAFRDGVFDTVVCIQNGVSAFKVEPRRLLRECLRVTRPGGRVLLSSYAAGFWPHRLEWFRLQAAHGLLGEIDDSATGNGVIVCKDGFRATTFGPEEFRRLLEEVGAQGRIEEVDESSVFCEVTVGPRGRDRALSRP